MTEKTIADEVFEKELWHKIAALLLSRLDPPDQSFTADEVLEILGDEVNTIVLSHHDGGTTMRLRFVTNEEAERIVKEGNT